MGREKVLRWRENADLRVQETKQIMCVCFLASVSTSQATPPHARMPRSEENCSINPFDKIARLYGGLRHKMRRSSDRDMAVRGKNITRRRAT